MKEDPKPTDKKFGKKVAACMISKAATEAWKVGTDVAAKVLTKAVEQHYGLPPGLSALISLAPALTNTQHLSPFNWPTA